MSSCPPSMDLKRRLTESNILSSKIRAIICENDQLIMCDFEEGGIFLPMGSEGIYSLGGGKTLSPCESNFRNRELILVGNDCKFSSIFLKSRAINRYYFYYVRP